jgi:hypothetical protein
VGLRLDRQWGMFRLSPFATTHWLGSLNAALCLSIFGSLSSVVLAAQPAVSGLVTFGQGNHSLKDAAVTLQDLADPNVVFKTTTNREGRYLFEEVPDGEYSLEATYPGFTGLRYSPIHIEFPLPVVRDFALPLLPGGEGGIQLSAEVVGTLKQAGHWLSHVKLCFLQTPNDRCTETNGIGQYYLAVQPGSYDVVVSANGSAVWKGHLDLTRVGLYRDKIQLDDGQIQK